MVGNERAGTEAGRIAPVHAATRPCGARLFVCPAGWSSDVHELTGATAAIWYRLDGPVSVDDLADRCGVPADDAMLAEALELLSNVGLVHPCSETDPE